VAWKKSPPALVERFEAIVPALSGAERRKMFGYPAAFVGGNMFAGRMPSVPARPTSRPWRAGR
jgi:hypothetical protein